MFEAECRGARRIATLVDGSAVPVGGSATIHLSAHASFYVALFDDTCRKLDQASSIFPLSAKVTKGRQPGR